VIENRRVCERETMKEDKMADNNSGVGLIASLKCPEQSLREKARERERMNNG
jgi:hypothetical protein